MCDMMLDALLPESMSDNNLVNFLGDLARTLECLYHDQIRRHHERVELEFYCSMSGEVMEDPPF